MTTIKHSLTPSASTIQQFEPLVPDPYDIEIVAAAWESKVDYFVALDRAHLVNNVAVPPCPSQWGRQVASYIGIERYQVAF